MPQPRKERKNLYPTNCFGDIEIVEDYMNDFCRVRFVNTGYERDARWANVTKGKVRDDSVKYESPKINLNEHRESNSTGPFTILWKKGKKCLVQFHETGYTTEANIDNARVGKVRDPYYPSSYGKGYYGEPENKPYKKQALQLWRNMLKRCYSSKDPRGYYGKGVSVDSRWLCFANFLEDLPKLRNFDKWLNGYKEGQPKFNLDKDLKIEGNKVYSREACEFVSEYDNKSAGGVNRQKLGWAKK